MRRASCLFLLIVLSQIVYAQNGKITGKVISASSGQALSGATLLIIEKNITKVADLNGVFSFSKLDTGAYSIKCSYVGFQDKIIEDIVVKSNENTDVNISLDTKMSGVVVVTSTKRVKAVGATVESLLIVQKNSASVSDGITAESIKKTPDSKGSDVIKRVSGASIQDDKFAVIRGLNDRYNASFINGAPLPSTESDRKAFAFDIFPSAILDNLVIFKTATPDKTGEFGGGIIEINTKSTSSRSIGIITIGQSYNSLITGNNRFFNEMKGKNDWLGLDDGTRALPDGIPADQNGFNTTPDEKLALAKRFSKYKWGVKTANTRPNFNFQLAKSFNINKKEQEFISSIFSLTYNRSFSFTTGERNSFEGPGTYTGDPNVPGYYPIQNRKYIDSIYNDEVIWSALGNISVKINNRNNISWKNNLSVNTDNKLVNRFGNPEFFNDPNFIINETFTSFTQDKILNSQLIGEHQIGNKKTKINWLAAYSKVNRAIPNQFISTVNTLLDEGSASGIGSTGSMVSTNSQENIKSTKIDITQPYTFMKNTQNFIKIGIGYQARERDFTSRALGMVGYRGSTYERDFSIQNLPNDQRFLSQYLGVLDNGKAGISVQDGTVPYSQYLASSTNTHAYIMNDQRFFKKLRLIVGVRMESFDQKLKAPQRGLDTIKVDLKKVDLLPSVNFVYALTSKTNVRFSYSETVNRPEYRELAPFSFFEYLSGLVVSGSNTLQRAKIQNYDFRFEIFPGSAQVLSFSSFYKKFDNPIEFSVDRTFISNAAYFNNPTATVFGLETEFRVLLSTLFGKNTKNTILNRFTLAGNAAYIKSKVLIGKKADGTELIRPLQGQSPYIINGSLAYNNEATGLTSTLSVNRIGERLALAGSIIFPDFYEKERTVIDFQLAKTFYNNNVEVKFNIRDLLAQNITVYLDNDKTQSFGEQDRIFSSNIAPRVFSFSASFKF